MMKKKDISVDFGKIYLPDVFSKKEMSRTLVLLLLADLLKESGLPSRQVSLFALVDALLENKQNVELLSRGKLFENKYQALWPDTDVIRKETASPALVKILQLAMICRSHHANAIIRYIPPKNTMLLIAISPICVPPFLSVRYDTCIVGVEA